MLGVPAWAQDAPAGASQNQSGGEAAQPPQSQYGGPTILSRGGSASVLHKGDTAILTPFLGTTGIYDSEYGGAGYGVTGMFGVTGSHVWPRTVLDVDFHGYYRNYADYAGGNGLDVSLNLGFQRQLTSRLSLSLYEDLARVRSIFSLPLSGLYGGGGYYNPLYSALTSNALLETPTLASVSGAQLVYRATARWSFSIGGTGMVSRQHATETLGMNGYGANASAAYRLNRYQTISFNYSFGRFTYKGQFGATDLHSAGAGYSVRLGRYWEFAATGGFSRVASLRDVAVTLDPVYAELLGYSVVFQKENDVFYMPYGTAILTRSFRHSSWVTSYDRSVVAGTGLYPTSNYQSAGTAYSYSGLRRLGLQAGAGYSQYSILAQQQSLGNYHSFGLGGGFTYTIARGFSSVGRLDWRWYSVTGSSLDRRGYYASFGLAWSPGAYPVGLW